MSSSGPSKVMITQGEDVMHVLTENNPKSSRVVGEVTTTIDAHIHRPASSTGESDVDGHLSSTSTGLESFNGECSEYDDEVPLKSSPNFQLTLEEKLEDIGGPLPLIKITPRIEDLAPVKPGVKRRSKVLKDVVFDFTPPSVPEKEYDKDENKKSVTPSVVGQLQHSSVVYLRSDAIKELCDMEDIEEPPRIVDVSKDLEHQKGMPRLVFDSMFECGNLLKATLRQATQGFHEYDLLLQNDLFTNGHTQWFYFSIENAPKDFQVKLNIINMRKSGSLFNEGMMPCTYSTYASKHKIYKKCGWRRQGTNIVYAANKNHPRLRLSDMAKKWYHLSWVHTFTYAKDKVYFAMSVPYSYSDLRRDLTMIRENNERNQHIVFQKLCDSIAGNEVQLLTVTARKESITDGKNRKIIFLSARVHPGETNASWMMRGILMFLTGGHPLAKTLREHFVFKIVPMLNPDGVINGNYRCNLSGVDLNRRWRTPNKYLHPTIYHLKKLMSDILGRREITVYIDFHGHSRKKNVFMYGCCPKNPDGQLNLAALRLPYLEDLVSPCFSFVDSSFHVSKSKLSTARVVAWKELGIHYSYTIEASFCGASIGSKAGKQFTTKDLEEIGEDCCKTLVEFFHLPGSTNVANQLPDALKPKNTVHKAVVEEEGTTPPLPNVPVSPPKIPSSAADKIIASLIDDTESVDDGSASDVSDDNLPESELQQLLQESLKPSNSSKKSKIFKVKKKTKRKKKRVRNSSKVSTPNSTSRKKSGQATTKQQTIEKSRQQQNDQQKQQPPQNQQMQQQIRRINTADFLKMRVEKSLAKKRSERRRMTEHMGLASTVNIGMSSSPMIKYNQFHLDPNYANNNNMTFSQRRLPPSVLFGRTSSGSSHSGGSRRNNSNSRNIPNVRHGSRQPSFFKNVVNDAEGVPYVQLQPNNLLSSDSQFGTMKAVTAIRALKAALARGEQQQSQSINAGDVANLESGKFGDIKTSQMASRILLRRDGHDSRGIKKSNSSAFLDAINSNSRESTSVRRIPSYPDILKHAGKNSLTHAYPPPVSPIRRSSGKNMVRASNTRTNWAVNGKIKKSQKNTRLSFKTIQIDAEI